MLIVDAHLDLAYNAVNHGRELRQELSALRALEPHGSAGGVATVTFPELAKGNVGLVFGTLFVMPADSAIGSIGEKSVYHNAAEAHKQAMTQLDYYHRLVDEDEQFRLVGDIKQLKEVIDSHKPGRSPLMGIVPLMEGADPIGRPEELEEWYYRGLRLIGLAWDDTRYASGAWKGASTGLTDDGRLLLEIMAEYKMILDLTHMSEKASFESLDRYEGPVVATHSNCRALVDGQRQLSDTQIRRVQERNGVIGVVLYNRFLRAHHAKGDRKELVTLDHVAAHIDHICQTLGDGLHVGIGSDFDGGFGSADIPSEMDSVADLPLIAGRLKSRGYSETDITNIMGGNWIHLLQRAWK